MSIVMAELAALGRRSELTILARCYMMWVCKTIAELHGTLVENLA